MKDIIKITIERKLSQTYRQYERKTKKEIMKIVETELKAHLWQIQPTDKTWYKMKIVFEVGG